MRKTKSVAAANDPQICWIDAFLALANRLDYQDAAKDLDESEKVVRERVRRLEAWLGRELIVPGRRLELQQPDGHEFALTAIGVMEAFDDCCTRKSTASAERERLEARARVRLSDLQTFLDLVEMGKYEALAVDSGRHVKTIRLAIERLDRAAGAPIFIGKGTGQLRPRSQTFFLTVREFVGSLRASKTSEDERLRYIKKNFPTAVH